MPTTTMKAIQKAHPARGAEWKQVAIPAIGPRDVLVRVEVASICGTDVHIYNWDAWSQSRIRPPLTFGHEFCGIVEKVGGEVTSIKPGNFVSAEMHVTCGLCLQCRTGQAHVCQKLKIIGIDADGCFAEFVRIPERNIWRLDDKIPREYAAILDPLGNAVHTVLSGDIAGQSVAVIGCGPIGQMSVAVAKACGAATIFAIEIKPERLALARKVGADVCIQTQKEDPVKRVLAETGGVGVDVMLEMSGHPPAIHQGFQMLRAGGRASLLGIPTQKVEMDLVAEVIFKGATVHGIYGRRIFDSWYRMTALIRSGRLNLDPLFTDRIPMEQFVPAFEKLSSGQGSKVLMYPQGLP